MPISISQLKEIIEEERRLEEIVRNAEKEAEKILEEAKRKAGEIMRKAESEEDITMAEEAERIEEEKRKLREEFELKIAEIRNAAMKKMETAINTIMSSVLGE